MAEQKVSPPMRITPPFHPLSHTRLTTGKPWLVIIILLLFSCQLSGCGVKRYPAAPGDRFRIMGKDAQGRPGPSADIDAAPAIQPEDSE